MVAELSNVERLALRQLWNGTYVQAVNGADDHLMNQLKREHEFVAWSDKRWMLTDKGRGYVDALIKGEKQRAATGAIETLCPIAKQTHPECSIEMKKLMLECVEARERFWQAQKAFEKLEYPTDFRTREGRQYKQAKQAKECAWDTSIMARVRLANRVMAEQGFPYLGDE